MGVAESFRNALLPDEIMLGGGNASDLKRLPAQTRRGDNDYAFLGGFRLSERQNQIDVEPIKIGWTLADKGNCQDLLVGEATA